jgi:hypothetical protein
MLPAAVIKEEPEKGEEARARAKAKIFFSLTTERKKTRPRKPRLETG